MSNSVSGERSTRVQTILGKRKRQTAPSPASVAKSLSSSSSLPSPAGVAESLSSSRSLPSPASVAESLSSSSSLTKCSNSFNLKELFKSLTDVSSKLNNSPKKPKEVYGAVDELYDSDDSDGPLEF